MYSRLDLLKDLLKEKLDSLILYRGGKFDSFFDGQSACYNQMINLLLDEDIIDFFKTELIKKNDILIEGSELFYIYLEEAVLFNMLKIITGRIKSHKAYLSNPVNYYKNNTVKEVSQTSDYLKESYIAGKLYYLEEVRVLVLDTLKKNKCMA